MDDNQSLEGNAPIQPANSETASSRLDYFSEQEQAEVRAINNAVEHIRAEIAKIVVGQSDMVELLLAGLLTGGHVLIEGVPGIAKTLTGKLLAKSLSVDFSRIQFTPDLMPTDVIGTSVFNMKDSSFTFNKGPIFSNVVLIDEINRAPAKTQAALFESMEEKQVTVDGHTYSLAEPFFVIATQNPVEQEGTYKLPEAQLDRFMFKIKITYPSMPDELAILKRFKEDFEGKQIEQVRPVLKADDLARCKSIVEKIVIKDELLEYIAQLIVNTRNNGDLFLGASPRASLSIMKTSKAIAALRGRNFVIPEDIQFVAPHVLNHRVILMPEREMEGLEPEDIISDIIKKIEVPR